MDSISEKSGANRGLKGARRRQLTPTDLSKIDRLPPHSPEAEQAVLGCVLLQPKECLTEAVSRLKGNKLAFYDLRHQTIFEHMIEMQTAGQTIDTITLMQHLKNAQALEQIGGLAYLSSLPDTVATATMLDAYLQIVIEKWQLRVMIHACTNAVGQCYEWTGDVNELIDTVQGDILELPTASQEGPQPLRAHGAALVDRLDRYARGIGMLTGLPTGFRYWDRTFAGLHPKDVIILGGDPGAGKTSLAMNVAERVAIDGGNPVGVCSLEMGSEDLILRLACSRARVNFHKLRTGGASKIDLDNVRGILPELMSEKKTPIFIDESSGLTLVEIRSRLRAMKHRYGIRLAIVDYLQLIALTREQMFLGMAAGYADVARGLQQAAKELNIPIIVLSQLSNEGRKRGKSEKPKLTDFRETGAIGDVANFAGILWRPTLGKDEDGNDQEEALRAAIKADPMGNHTLPVEMEVVKNKNGPAGTGIEFNFMRWCMRFEDLQYESKAPELPKNPVVDFTHERLSKIDDADVPKTKPKTP